MQLTGRNSNQACGFTSYSHVFPTRRNAIFPARSQRFVNRCVTELRRRPRTSLQWSLANFSRANNREGAWSEWRHSKAIRQRVLIEPFAVVFPIPATFYTKKLCQYVYLHWNEACTIHFSINYHTKKIAICFNVHFNYSSLLLKKKTEFSLQGAQVTNYVTTDLNCSHGIRWSKNYLLLVNLEVVAHQSRRCDWFNAYFLDTMFLGIGILEVVRSRSKVPAQCRHKAGRLTSYVFCLTSRPCGTAVSREKRKGGRKQRERVLVRR